MLLTPPSELKPPYPASKLLSGGRSDAQAQAHDQRQRARHCRRAGRTRRPRVPRCGPPLPPRPLALSAGDRGRARDRVLDRHHASLRARRLRLRRPRAERHALARPRSPIFAGMSWFPRPSSPRRCISRPRRLHAAAQPRAGDRRQPGPARHRDHRHRVPGRPQDRTPRRRRRSSRFELYPSNRTDAEIIADQKKDMAEKKAAEEGTAARSIKQLAKAARHID